MQSWSTDHLDARDRADYWREVLCQTYVALDTRMASTSDFHGTVSAHALSTVNVTTLSSSRQEIVRGRSEISRMPKDVYFLNLQVRGQCKMSQAGRSAFIQAGEFAVVDSMEPYVNDYCSDDWEQHSFRIPHHLLMPLLVRPRLCTATKVQRDGGLGTVAIDYLTSIAQRSSALPDAAGEKLADTLIDLVALSLGATNDVRESAQGSLRESLCQSIIAHIRLNAADPSISPTNVAQHFRISTRYLHKVLELGGRSFGRILLESRLERCAQDLRSADATPSISQVAYRWGFNDLSHFSRTFKNQFGSSPRDFRRMAV